MNTEYEVREELNRLFPGESNDARFDEWFALVNDGLMVAAANRIRKWAIEAELNRTKVLEETERRQKLATNYTELTESHLPSGIKVQGFTYIGRIRSDDDLISLEAVEFVDIDVKLASYKIQVLISQNDRKYYSTVKYDEIQKLLNAIKAMKRASTSVTEFKRFQINWISEGDFSISVFSSEGNITGEIKSKEASIFLNTLQKFDELEDLFTTARSYIDKHLQCVGSIDFVLSNRITRSKAELLEKLPDLVAERATPYAQILSKKFLQLTYLDDYGTREYGSFLSEMDRFIGKIIPDLHEDHREFAKKIIVSMVENSALDHENNSGGFNVNMNPMEYERYCANYFSQAGWVTSMTPKTGDQGADIVIKHNDLTGVVQCKLYSQPVGNTAVQEVVAAREYYRASIAFVVSNAAYTVSARQLAAMANVVLLHHDEIAPHSLKLGVERFVEQKAEL